MDTWITIWTVVFALTLLVFSVLVIVVGIGGWPDIKAMFTALDSQNDSEESGEL